MTMRYPIGAGMVVVREFDQIGTKLLVLKGFDGMWDLPKGHINSGETPFECAVREMKEEVSITSVSFPWGKTYKKLQNLTFFMCKTNQDPVIVPNPEHGYCEHESVWWVNPEDAEALLPAFLRPAIRWAINSLGQ